MSPMERQTIESEIERLIGILDNMDPDPDLEPSLGPNGYLRNGVGDTDLEDEHDGRELCCEDAA